jgi:bilirubin oxidase
MPSAGLNYYEIAVRQFQQQILPFDLSPTTVWSYGAANNPATFHYPAFTIEARVNRPVRVKWINQLLTAQGKFLPHLLPVDQTLHWANPPGGLSGRDMHGDDPTPYRGPVPIVTHVHGAHVDPESDGHPEAWYLPDATDIPGFATRGSHWGQYAGAPVENGAATFRYRNDQRATTLWYHDHSLGMTRVNVYAGPAGFYLLRGGPDGSPVFGTLPGPAPAEGDPPGMKYYEIPIVIQDRSFNNDGSLFYPDSRRFFDGFKGPYAPESDIAPIWNPEFFGNTMVVNGRTWPFLNVERRRYRLRFLNGCNSRFLILKFDNGLPFWQIGTEGGFLPAPVQLDRLLIALAERADVIVDFTNVPVGTNITLLNVGPDEPFGGGEPGVDFAPSDPGTTGQVMQFRVVSSAATGTDTSTPPGLLRLPHLETLPSTSTRRALSLNELDSAVLPGVGPQSARLGTLDATGAGVPLAWMDKITENIPFGATEIWELHNFTEDAHPIHVHLVQFQVVDRQPFGGITRPPEIWETGFKDTVIAYPGEITRLKARFDIHGEYVWHCHIIEHEDNEMMRPYMVL